ncbi:NUDIX hydrolase [Streptomyces sp. NPDC014676]|uniref:NUDIX hydrolase n=1 Tax=Streptomyces sp. NPDC014676 TaxID=3364879 RepID=UPI0037013360
MSEEPHLLITDAAQVLLRSNGAALCVRRTADAARREAKKEAGVVISAEQQESCGLMHHHEPGSGPDRINTVSVTRSWTGEPYNAEPDKHEGLFRVPRERPSLDCHPCTTTTFHMLTHGPSYRATDRPAGGAR